MEVSIFRGNNLLVTVAWSKVPYHTIIMSFHFGSHTSFGDNGSLLTCDYKYSLLMHCIKIKSPAKFLLNEQYVFVGGNISFLCVLSYSSDET